MRSLVIAAALAANAAPALAQQPPQSIKPEDFAAINGKLSEEINAELVWRSRAIAAEAQVKELQVELAKLKPKDGRSTETPLPGAPELPKDVVPK